MSTHRYALPLEETRWNIPGVESTVAFNWEYDSGRQRMLNLYEKGKDKQWNTQTRIDWSHDVDTSNQEMAPDEIVPIFGSGPWEKMSRAEKDEVRHHYVAWTNSQFLHGEQGALVCSAKIVETVPDMDSKFYAATQTMDEARHVETYAKFLNEKLDLCYPINESLQELLNQTITDKRWDFTYLGMQVMIEGVALAAFSMIRDFTGDPLGKSINAYVMQDEARHIAFGRLALKDAYADLTEAERAEREEFVVEASYLLRDRFLAKEVWDNLGMDGDEMAAYVDKHQMMTEFRKALFSRVVPTVKDIGLWGSEVQKAYIDMGVMQFQDLDVDELSDNDERIAEELEELLARQKAEGVLTDDGSRAAAMAETIAAGGSVPASLQEARGLRITVCQLSDIPAELEEQWAGLAAHCAGERPDLVVLPELGFSPWLAATEVPDQAAWDDSVAVHERWLERLPELGAAVVVGSVPVVDAGRNHNAAFVWTADAGVVHAHRKYHLPDEPGFSEARWYEPGPKEFAPVDTPVAKLGFLLCTELWFTEHARAYARAGVEVLASPRGVGMASLGKWIAGGRVGAVMSGAYGVSSNRGGVDARGFEWAGGGWIIEPEEGEVLGVTSVDEPFLTRDVDLAVAHRAKSTYPRYVPD